MHLLPQRHRELLYIPAPVDLLLDHPLLQLLQDLLEALLQFCVFGFVVAKAAAEERVVLDRRLCAEGHHVAEPAVDA